MKNFRYDKELAVHLDRAQPVRTSLTPEEIRPRRAAWLPPSIDDVLHGRPLEAFDVAIKRDGVEVIATIVRRSDHQGLGPGMLHAHAGGMVMGSRFTGIEMIADWAERFDMVCVLPEYRLAPESAFPAALDDCYTTLVWAAENATDIGIDPARLFVAGMSAGGGLVAGLALRARDEEGPHLIGQLLMCPMLDARNDTRSAQEFHGTGLWDQESNAVAWDALLRVERQDPPRYASPAQMSDLDNLPPTFIDVGAMEGFRDEDVDYARSLWAAGVETELHVWRGAFHGFDLDFPDTAVSRAARAARDSWISRILA